MNIDLNILNRASFDDKQIRHRLIVQPTLYEGTNSLDLGGVTNVLWIKEIKWQYVYIDVGMYGAKRTAPQPIKVTVADILRDDTNPYPPFIQPKPVVGRVDFRVVNTNLANNHRLEVEFLINGVLVRPKAGTGDPLTLKEMLAYIMLDSSKKGELAFAEAQADHLDEKLAEMGLGSLRNQLPKGLGALKNLPEPMQAAVIKSMAAKGELPPALAEALAPQFALPGTASAMPGMPNHLQLTAEVNSEKEESAFIGDMLNVSPDECQGILTKPILQKLAKAMVEKGWRRV